MWVIILACALHFCASTGVSAQSSVNGSFENYFEFSSQHGGSSTLRTSYLTAQDQLTPTTQLVIGSLRKSGTALLDENYLMQNLRGGVLRVGRFRTQFGHSDWAECYYMGLPKTPLLRANGIDYDDAARLNLKRLDTGADYLITSGNMQYQVGLIDMSSQRYQLAPRTWNTAVCRAQTYFGSWILGFNGLANFGNHLGQNSVTMYGVDWRWTAPAIQWRGELISSETGGLSIAGYYQDLSYHTLKIPKSTFLLRTEEVRSSGGLDETSTLETIGVKQSVSPLFVVELSQAWGNHSALALQNRGTTLQLISLMRF